MGAIRRGAKRLGFRIGRPIVSRYRHAVHESTRGADEAAAINRRLDTLANQMRVDAEVMAEFSRLSRRVLNDLDAQIDEIGILQDGGLVERFVLGDPDLRDRVMGKLVGRPLADLGPGESAYLQWATGPDGYRSQAHVYFQDPIAIGHSTGKCFVAWVSERIVEVPFVFRVVTSLPPGSRVLDVGACFSTVSLSLASMDYRVTALDIRPYPITHRNLEAVACPIEQWVGPAEPFDAIVALSTIEHLGIGHYGDQGGRPDADRDAMKSLQSWLKPDGLLVLTVPYGPWSVDDLQRIYDADHLAQLLEGWVVESADYFVQHDRLGDWHADDAEMTASWSEDSRGVVLVTARPQ